MSRPDWTDLDRTAFDASADLGALFDLAPENVPTPDALF